MADIDETVRILSRLSEMGHHLSVDDFGTGYSSLSYLRRLPLHELKIDRSFVSQIATPPKDFAIVAATVRLAHALDLHVVAEGVETPEQMEFVCRAGCDQMQGYLFGRPMTAADLGRLLSKSPQPSTIQHAQPVASETISASSSNEMTCEKRSGLR